MSGQGEVCLDIAGFSPFQVSAASFALGRGVAEPEEETS